MDKIQVTVVSITGLTKHDLPEVFKLAAGEPVVVSKRVETSKVEMTAHADGPAAPAAPAEPKGEQEAPAPAPAKSAGTKATTPAAPKKDPAAPAAPAPAKETSAPKETKPAGGSVTPIREGRPAANGKASGQQKLIQEEDVPEEEGQEAADERQPGEDEGEEAGEEAGAVDLEGLPEELLRSVKHSDIVKAMAKKGHNQDQIVEACKRIKKEGLAPSIVKLVDVETRVRATCNAEGID